MDTKHITPSEKETTNSVTELIQTPSRGSISISRFGRRSSISDAYGLGFDPDESLEIREEKSRRRRGKFSTGKRGKRPLLNKKNEKNEKNKKKNFTKKGEDTKEEIIDLKEDAKWLSSLKKNQRRNRKHLEMELMQQREKDKEEAEIEALVVKKREELDSAENYSLRRFQFAISGIRVRFLAKYTLGNIFLEFEIGGQSEEVDSEEIEQKETKKKHETKDGGQEEITATVSVPKKTIRVLRAPSKRFYTKMVKISIAGDSDAPIGFRGMGVTGEWHGTYNHLRDDLLTLRVWHRKLWGPNILIGTGELNLQEVAQGKQDTEMIIFKRTAEEVSRKEAMCLINFKFELEELFLFKLRFENWELNLVENKNPIKPLCCEREYHSQDEQDETGPKRWRGPLAIEMALRNTTYGCGFLPFFLCMPTQIRSLWAQFHAGKWMSTPGGGIVHGAYLPYYGTRSKLEDERLELSVYKGHRCGDACAGYGFLRSLVSCFRGPMLGYYDQTLQGKLDYGYVIIRGFTLRNFPSTCLAYPCFFTRKILEMCGLYRYKKDGWGAKFMAGAKGVIKVEKEPRYRQLGNVGRPSGASRFLKLFPQRGDLYLALKIMRVRGLIPLGDEFKESLSPSVTVDWAQTRRETRIAVDEAEPLFDEWLFFRIPRPAKLRKKVPSQLEHFGPFAGTKLSINIWDNAAFSKRSLGICELDFERIFRSRKQRTIESATKFGTQVSRYVFQTKIPLKAPKLRQELKGEVPRNFPENRGIEVLAYFDMGAYVVGPPKRSPAKRSKDREYKARLEAHARDPYADQQRPPIPPESFTSEMEKTSKKLGIPTRRAEPVTDKQYSKAREFWRQSLAHVPKAASRNFSFCGIDEYSGHLYYLPSFLSPIVPPSSICKESQVLSFVHSIQLGRRKQGRRFNIAKEKMEKLGGPGDLQIWTDPWTFLDKRRGDHRDHALLLCNFLLGIFKHAYVCIGKVRIKNEKGEKVKTAEHVWVLTLEEEDSKEPGFFQTVRFWEPSHGRTYVRMNPPRTRRDKEAIASKKDDANPLDVENLLKASLRLDDAEQNDDIGELPSQIPDYSVVSSLTASRIHAERDKIRFQYAIQQGLKLERDSKYRTRLRRWQSQRVPQEQWNENSKFYEKKLEDRKSKQISIDERPLLHPEQDQLPYTHIDVVFNNEVLFANLQSPDPHGIQYDFLNKDRWKSFRGKKSKDGKNQEGGGEQYFWRRGTGQRITQFYPDKTMVAAKAPPEAVRLREEELLIVLQQGIKAFRELESRSTKFLDIFQFQENLIGSDHTAEKYIKERLKKEFELGDADESLVLKEQRKPTTAEEDIMVVRKLWQYEIVTNLPEDQIFEESILAFKHADISRISSQVISRLSKRMFSVPDSRNPQFTVGVMIRRMPGSVSPARVMVCCICDKKK
mmetsp:Transcript_3501/g.5228  ORF Transcript_3501/g.5228 Transcript_3501/m.5228 type:complete len:1411 (-) Transcript_3501:156-4388(-)